MPVQSKPSKFDLKWAGPGDYDALGQLMYAAVRHGPSRYSEDQRRAWVPAPRSGDDWHRRLANQAIIIAERDGIYAGFMSLEPGGEGRGYLDFAYIRPAYQGTGLFRRLYARIEEKARETGLTRIDVHASLMAQPAFSAVGFEIVQPEQVRIGDQVFDRFAMEKRLDAGEDA